MHTRRIAANDGAMLLLLLRDVMKCIVVVGKKLVIMAQGLLSYHTDDVAADRGREAWCGMFFNFGQICVFYLRCESLK